MPRLKWDTAQDNSLRTLYPHIRTDDCARILGGNLNRIYARAKRLGLHKSDEFIASPLSGRNFKGHAPNGIAGRFKPGNTPANKGQRHPGWSPGRMRETQFKKGHQPKNRDPEFYVLGALRVNSDGYIDMRVSFEPGAKGWRALHLILWEEAHGPLKPGYMLRFKDGDKLNVCLENLEYLTRSENMKRNSIYVRLPPDLRQAVQLLRVLKRQINRKQRHGQQTQHR